MALMLRGHVDARATCRRPPEKPTRARRFIIRGLALGLLFTPINNVAFGNLKPEEAQQASGLINLARQLGGSFGIAVLGAYLTRHIAYHRADLITNIYPGNPAFEGRYDGLISALRAQGASLVDAQQRALAIIDGTLMRQAAMQAYNDAWLLSADLLRLRRAGGVPAASAGPTRRAGGRRPLSRPRRYAVLTRASAASTIFSAVRPWC